MCASCGMRLLIFREKVDAEITPSLRLERPVVEVIAEVAGANQLEASCGPPLRRAGNGDGDDAKAEAQRLGGDRHAGVDIQ